MDFLDFFIADFHPPALSLSPPSRPMPDGAMRVEVDGQRKIRVSVTVGGREFPAILDTGARRTAINSAAASALGLLRKLPVYVADLGAFREMGGARLPPRSSGWICCRGRASCSRREPAGSASPTCKPECGCREFPPCARAGGGRSRSSTGGRPSSRDPFRR
jgi:hypothetical protein